MNPSTRKLSLLGPAGVLEALLDMPELAQGQSPRGLAVIAHPHPLFGGTMDNKVVQTLARAFVQTGWQAVRFNFRGVGASQGVYDNGQGELQDLLAVVQRCTADLGPPAAKPGDLALAGFSFGAYVASHAVHALSVARDISKLVLVGTAASRFPVAPVERTLHERTLVIHGEQDDTVPLVDVMDWARPQNLPVTVIPGVAHFFHGQLPLLRSLVVRHLTSI
ncbi:MAG: alpha/beta family hydrolase [Betaproteobacteria bacterium]